MLDPVILGAHLPPPPRKVLGGPGVGVWVMRVFMLPHTVVGIGLIGALLVTALACLYGTDTTGYVTSTRTGSSKGHATYTVEYRYDGAAPGLTGETSVTPAIYASLKRTKGAAPAEVQVSHYELGPIHVSELAVVETLSSRLGFLSVFAAIWNASIGIFLWALYVVPYRDKQLVRLGARTPGKVTAKRTSRGRNTSYYVSYGYETASGELVEQEMGTRSELWSQLEEGAAVTVLYWPDRPKRSVAYELCNYRVHADAR